MGLGATSFINGALTARPRTMVDYIEWVHYNQNNNNDKHHHDTNDQHPDDDDDILLSSSSRNDDDDDDDDEFITVIVDDDDLLTEIVMKQLRTSDGLDLNVIGNRFGLTAVDAILRGAQLGLELGLVNYRQRKLPENDHSSSNNDKNGILYLVDPDGFLYSNTIISSIFYELEKATES